MDELPGCFYDSSNCRGLLELLLKSKLIIKVQKRGLYPKVGHYCNLINEYKVFFTLMSSPFYTIFRIL